MGKPIEKAYGQEKTILKFNDYKAFSAVLTSNQGIIKAGTPYPANDSTCKGFVLHDTDTTQGDAPAAIVYEGALDMAKITANGVTITDNAKNAVKRVTFF